MRSRPMWAMGIVALLTGVAANADVVATCGPSKGWGYYVRGGLNEDQKPEMIEDWISKGSFQLIRRRGEFDIVITDASGGTFSSTADGGTVIAAETPAGDYVVHVFYPRLVETYVFWLSDDPPTVSFSQAKFATPVPKHSLMVATCRKGP